MTSKTLKSAILLTMVASAAAIAAGGPPPGKGKPPTEATNNLSVPAIMVAGTAGTLPAGCTGTWSTLLPPTGYPLTGFSIDGYYFVQKVHTWQAQCRTGAADGSVLVYGEWGDNLSGDARLKAGSPIRVELVLLADGVETADGYEVLKLEPEKLDRESAYGTLATDVGAEVYEATAVPMTPVVHDGKATLLITEVGAVDPESDFWLYFDPIAPEINATGKVVYGYNLTVPAPGQYVITFTMPSVTFTGCDAGSCGSNTATMTITVGGGGGKRPPR